MTTSLVQRDRRLSTSPSSWVRSFAAEHMRPLIVCRGPIRKEALDVFREMGMTAVGILLSEKDSIVYTNALAPELREHDPRRVHRVQDYSGVNREERERRTQEIIAIAKKHGYDSIFAGYGFMSEDEDFVRAIETAGLVFIGPNSSVQRAAGRKDEAKRTAMREGVSITPGALVGQKKAGDNHSVEEIAAEAKEAVAVLLREHPGSRIRLKWVGGGGGKGQRIVDSPAKV